MARIGNKREEEISLRDGEREKFDSRSTKESLSRKLGQALKILKWMKAFIVRSLDRVYSSLLTFLSTKWMVFEKGRLK